MLVMVVFFIAFRWIHLSTPLIRLFLLVLILLLMPTLNFLPVWFALSLLRFRLPSRLPMMFILWMVAMMVVIIPSNQYNYPKKKGIKDECSRLLEASTMKSRRGFAIQRFHSGGLQQSRSEERFSRNAETELVCRLLLEKKNCDACVPKRPVPRRLAERRVQNRIL